MLQFPSVLLSTPRMGHIPEEELEAYALGKSSDEDALHLEAHLLACDECCLRLVHEAQFIEALRYALFDFIRRDFKASDPDYPSPAAASSASLNPMASRKALRTSAGCPS
ncbi:MAG TPA: hypothetical protein VN841_14320 [Bryobacteraceae bacterium]|nr:hypothetical protein [Bryobacteraceae bacterium]